VGISTLLQKVVVAICHSQCLYRPCKALEFKLKISGPVSLGESLGLEKPWDVEIWSLVFYCEGTSIVACVLGGTDVSELMRGLATLPPRWIQEPVVVRDSDGRPPRGPSGSALLLCV